MLSMNSGSEILPHPHAVGACDAPSAGGGPLAGRHIAVTWSAEQRPILTPHLEAAGARVTPLFASVAVPVGATAALDAALLDLSRYDWVVLTSLAGVHAFAKRLAALHMGPGVCCHIHIAMLFPVTARAQELAALPPQLVPDAVLADDIAAGLRDIAGKRILLLSGEQMHGTLAATLRQRGAEVDHVSAYRLIAHPVDGQSLRYVLMHRRVDAIMCTSAVMAEGMLAGLVAVGQELAEALRTIPLIALDVAAAAPLREAGLAPAVAVAAALTDHAAMLLWQQLVLAFVSATTAETIPA
ncbi:MAG TPA: uroporphyrinogen-III synthase [Ktedonobacterales bacterium]